MRRPIWFAALVLGAIVTSCQPADDSAPAVEARSEQSLVVQASAYNSVPAQTDSLPNEGAWGDVLEPGMRVVAVSPDLLEAGLDRGTVVSIEGLEGTWTVLDRTASRLRNRIDIYMGTDVDAAIEWGIREVTIRWTR